MYMMERTGAENVWEEMHARAMAVMRPREVSRLLKIGSVAAAVESVSGKIYVGVCVKTECGLGTCAERNAIFNMLTAGENAIRRVIAVNYRGRAMSPCGCCREFMAQLMPGRFQEI